ncbi:MAG TPA: hypothetical protein VHW73_10150 [Rudaea sp.]|jgi:hypothetical protein|nr:hypothetical protein [Rudaea sp.]
MARASSSTVCLEVKSRASGALSIVTERTWYRSSIVNGRVVRSPLQVELKDAAGRRCDRLSANLLRCVAVNEDYDVQGIAPSIRPRDDSPRRY